MNATKILKALLIAAALYAAAPVNAQTIQIAMEEGRSVAKFKVGDSRCVLKDDQIRCTPLGK